MYGSCTYCHKKEIFTYYLEDFLLVLIRSQLSSEFTAKYMVSLGFFVRLLPSKTRFSGAAVTQPKLPKVGNRRDIRHCFQ